ncbi:hypothetical protein Tco_1283918 [Tanacetum coccineum]
MVSFGRQSDFRVGDEDFQDIRGVGYNDDFVITPQASSSTEDAVNHLRSKSQMSNESDKASMLDEAIEYLNTLKMQFRFSTLSHLVFMDLKCIEVFREKKTVCADLVYGAKNKKLSVKELLECQPRFSISQSGSLPMVKETDITQKDEKRSQNGKPNMEWKRL